MTYEIRNGFFHKGYVFLVSVVNGAAMFSTNKYQGSRDISLEGLKAIFQRDHDRQIEELIKEYIKNKHLDDERYKKLTREFVKPLLN